MAEFTENQHELFSESLRWSTSQLEVDLALQEAVLVRK